MTAITRPDCCEHVDAPAVDCRQCSLSSYGLDCRNNPIPTAPRWSQPRGRRAALDAYTGHRGHATIAAVEAGIPAELRERLTGREYGLVMSAVNDAYHEGRASLGGLDLCDDVLWLPWGGPNDKGQLVPIAVLRQIAVTSRRYTLDAVDPLFATAEQPNTTER